MLENYIYYLFYAYIYYNEFNTYVYPIYQLYKFIDWSFNKRKKSNKFYSIEKVEDDFVNIELQQLKN
jgi:hypothetical protein